MALPPDVRVHRVRFREGTDVLVGRGRRRQGIGSQLLALIARATAAESRSLQMWSTFGSAPAGDAFSRHSDAGAVRLDRTSELRLGEVDWAVRHALDARSG